MSVSTGCYIIVKFSEILSLIKSKLLLSSTFWNICSLEMTSPILNRFLKLPPTKLLRPGGN